VVNVVLDEMIHIQQRDLARKILLFVGVFY